MMPFPAAETPKLKNRAWVENRGESGSKRTAKGSSNDSSMSLMWIEAFRLNGGLLQSKSIATFKVYPSPIHCIYIVNTRRSMHCQAVIFWYSSNPDRQRARTRPSQHRN